MKTATIEIHHIYGTKNQYLAMVKYRNKVLKRLDCNDVLSWDAMKRGLINAAKAWATVNGFSHYKIEVYQ
jgi:hypothetical protein